ncbi:MAG TPA: response regulator, partial [Myxococcota bacterium]|nr:response regulator [Myxococcota bacterium]
MPVTHCLLRLLMEGPTHGYHLRRNLTALRDFYPLSNINVYPVLKDLEGGGLVCSRSELVDSRVRKIYEITAEGVAEFERWMEIAPEGPASSVTDLVALKLVLAPSREGAGLTWLPRSLTDLDDEILRWRKYAQDQRKTMTRLALLTAEYRISALELRRGYLDEAMRISRDAGNGSTPHARRVLVADDSSASRALAKHLLSAAGYEVELAENGAQAWELLQEHVFDALVSDALMPEVDGFELVRRVRDSADLAELPVVLNTVLDEGKEREAALAAGANDFVCKSNEHSGRQLVDVVDRLT